MEPTEPERTSKRDRTSVPNCNTESDLNVEPVLDTEADLNTEGSVSSREISLRFEAAWEYGTATPRLEDYLPLLHTQEREPLFHELLKIETLHRKRRGESPSGSEYVARFPHYKQLVDDFFRMAFPGIEDQPVRRALEHDAEDSDQTVDFHDSHPTGLRSNSDDAQAATLVARNGDHNRFVIRKPVARGGLGIVFLAHDRQLNREVALKKVREDRTQSSILQQKFFLEAEITGQLEHPGVVPIYALGADAQGQPFYAMRFIQGTELKERIRQLHKQSPQGIDFFGVDFYRLLKRFQDVCNTIGYAHSRGVIHRDLKPSNVMLGSHGETLVVDWGLAKAIGDSVSQPDSHGKAYRVESPVRPRYHDYQFVTQYGSFSGTIPYASPEQLMGHVDHLRPASDVYSLGTILFEILTNEPPLAGSIPSIGEAIQRIQNSDNLDPRNRNRSIPLPLALICRKALSWAPEDRYRTAFELSEDLDRWMADERVLAIGYREPWSEWFGRLLRKYRRWTAPLALTILFSAAVLTVGLLLVNQARLAERKAKESEEIAKAQEIVNKQEALQRNAIARDAIDSLLVESSRTLADFPATRDLQKRLLAAAAADYERLSQGSSQDEGLQLERVRALVRVADIEALQGNATGSNELYEQSIRSLESKISEMANRDEARTRWELELAKTIARRGLAWDTQDRIDESRVEYEHAQKIFDRLLLANPSDVSIQFFTSRTQAQHADLIGRTESPTTAIPILQTALAGYERVSPETEPRVTRELAKAKESLARFMGQLGRFDDAIAELESLLQASPSSSESANDDRHLHERTASVHVSLANLHRQTGNLARALSSLEQSRQVYSQLRQSWPDSLEYIENEASVRADIGFLWIDRRNPNRSQGELEQAKSTFEELSQNYPSVYRYATGWGTSVSGLGQIALVSEADAAIAVDLLNRCRSLLQNLAVRESDPRSIELLAAVIGQLARARERAGELDQARESFTLSRDYFTQMIEQRPGEPRYEYGLADVEWHAANFERRAGNKDQAAALFESACTRMRNLWDRYPKNRQYLARVALFDVRLALWSGNVPEQTVAIAQQSIENPIDEEFETPEAIGLRAWVAWQQGNTDQVREQLRELRDLAKAQLPYDIDLNDWIQELENRFASAAR